MYGSDSGIVAGALAATGTGIATGSIVLAAVGLILAGWALYLLFRKNHKNKP